MCSGWCNKLIKQHHPVSWSKIFIYFGQYPKVLQYLILNVQYLIKSNFSGDRCVFMYVYLHLLCIFCMLWVSQVTFGPSVRQQVTGLFFFCHVFSYSKLVTVFLFWSKSFGFLSSSFLLFFKIRLRIE